MSAEQRFSSIAVIGAGAWGTALAQLCARNGIDTLIWAREDEVANQINETGENKIFLPGAVLDKRLKATSDLSQTGQAEAYLLVTPVQHSRPVLGQLCHFVKESAPIALCSKGVETATGLLMTEVLSTMCPGAQPAVLSGPSFAVDVASGLPTAVTLACADKSMGRRWVESIGATHFRPYLSDDLVGAELGGAVKNVLAIASGVVAGKALGESARAALIARGFAEFQRLGIALGAKPQTMAGLSGLGDLILTASSAQSRNMSLGIELGKGRALSDVLGERNTVSEGVATAEAVRALATKANVEMPICAAVADLVADRRSVDEVITQLLSRPFTTEMQ